MICLLAKLNAGVYFGQLSNFVMVGILNVLEMCLIPQNHMEELGDKIPVK